jgi:four helix bundle protein
MNTYKDLIVWQKSMTLCTNVYKVTRLFPKDELYGIVSQMRRSSVAIPSNIAEGYRRGHRLEYLQFLRISYGSASELETQLIVSLNIKYLTESQYDELNNLLEEVLKMLNKLISSLHPTP